MGISKSHLKELRAYIKRNKRGGMSQRTLAAVAGVSEPTFSKVLHGTRHFSADAAGRLASLTGIPVEKLLTDPNDSQIVKLLGKRLHASSKKVGDNANVA
jgi:transcriptional regulator with XRE-family HTH domain